MVTSQVVNYGVEGIRIAMGTLLENNRAVLDGRIVLLTERIDELETTIHVQVAKLREPLDQLHAELQVLMKERRDLDDFVPAIDPDALDN
ncbi:hypothetical protein GCM10009121_03550 [Rhodanobacter soli]